MTPETVHQGLVGPSHEGQAHARPGDAFQRRHDRARRWSFPEGLLVRWCHNPWKLGGDTVRGWWLAYGAVDAKVPEALYRRSRGPECNRARGRDSCVSRRSRWHRPSALDRVVGPSTQMSRSSLGVAFWIVLDPCRVRSARPPPARHATGGRDGARAGRDHVLGGPAVGGWVAALGTTEMRELRGRIPWYGTLANHAGHCSARHRGGHCSLGDHQRRRSAQSGNALIDFVASDGRGRRLLRAQCCRSPAALLALRTGQPS